MTPIGLCQRCDCRGPMEPGGLIRCKESGKSIIDHAAAKCCPRGFFAWPAKEIPPDYVPTPQNAVAGQCGCGR